MKILAKPKYGKFNSYNTELNKIIESKDIQVDDLKISNLFWNKYDIFHMHFPTSIIDQGNFATILIRLIIYKLLFVILRFKNTKIIWTAHNIECHQPKSKILERILWCITLNNLDGIIYLNKFAKTKFCKKYKKAKLLKSIIISEGLRREHYGEKIDKETALSKLKLPKGKKVIGNIGNISEYKNILELIDNFNDLNDENTILLIAGFCHDKALDKKILSKLNNRIYYINSFIDEKELGLYYSVLDLMVLPYKNITNSGTALNSINFGVPVLGPNNDTFTELKHLFGSNYIYTYQSEQLCRNSIKSTLLSVVAAPPLYMNEVPAKYNWAYSVDSTIQFYKLFQ